MSYLTRKKKSASERGKRMANRRWQLDRARRDAIAAADPLRVSGKILRRIVVIENETTVKETTIYDFDSARSARAKIRRVLTEP